MRQSEEARLTEEDERPPQLAIIGSSAGGIDALSAIVRTLPADMPVPIVVAQHLDPRRPSHLTEILARHSTIPVETVEHRVTLMPGRVFVLPPGSHAEITDHEIRLMEPTEKGPRPSIDVLLSSAAQTFGEGLIAVILTGTGHDGAAGARDVKALGGTVVIQNPKTASYPGMPLALSPTSVDIVAELDAIGPLLHALATGEYAPTRPDDERLLSTFLDQLRERSGIDFGSYKRATIVRRLQRRMIATGKPKLRDYIRFVQKNPEEYARLTASFLIKVTEFFRDPDLFDHLRSTIIPQLIEAARDRDRALRFWSAGCATGEEAYSLAILIAEALGDELDLFNVRIFATDVDAAAIAFARRGVYPERTVAALPADLVERYFSRVDDGFEIGKRIRMVTVFGQHDLAQRAPFPSVDLALCRNVLIYFTTELQKRALQLFAFSLRDGGFLVLGKAESTSPLPESFAVANPRLKVFRRQGDRIVIPPARIREATPLLPVRAAGGRASWIDATLAKARETQRGSSAGDKAETVLLRLPVGVVVVDHAYDIEWINSAARNLLGIHRPGIGSDIVHLVPPHAAEAVRAVIDAVARGEPNERVISIPAPTPTGTEVRSIKLTARPGPSEDPNGASGRGSVMVVLNDVTAEHVQRVGLEEALGQERATRDQLVERGRHIAESHAQLLEANDELTMANAELRSANEELLVANEEVQAATEEVETLNEELQATNEELETLNEELQATVEELNTTNDDLQARNVDALAGGDPAAAQDGAILAAAQRLLGETEPLAIIAATPDGDLQNVAFRALFTDTVVRTADGTPLDPADHPVARARRGETFELTLDVHKGRRRLGRHVVRSSPIAAGERAPLIVEAREVN